MANRGPRLTARRSAAPEGCVVDNSVVTGWWHPAQATPYTDRVLAAALAGYAHVPMLWALEFANLVRRFRLERRINDAQLEQVLNDIADIPLRLDHEGAGPRQIVHLCLRYGLSAYDAAYLELALRRQLPLACKDNPLAEAAKLAGIGVF